MFVARAWSLTAAAACTDEPKHRMVVAKGWNLCRLIPTCLCPKGSGRHEPASASTNAREVTTLDQAPNSRTGHPKRTTRFVNSDHLNGHDPNRSMNEERRIMARRSAALRR